MFGKTGGAFSCVTEISVNISCEYRKVFLKRLAVLAILVSAQVVREAYFSSQSYLQLDVTDANSLKSEFYGSFSFRTDEKDGLMLFHRDQVRGGGLPDAPRVSRAFSLRFPRAAHCSVSAAAGGILSGHLGEGPHRGEDRRQRGQVSEDVQRQQQPQCRFLQQP